MKKHTWVLLPLLILLQSSISVSSETFQNYQYSHLLDVQGRQGIASDGEYYYVSDTKGLYKYSKDGKVLLENLTPFAGLPIAANHFGDIDVYNGEIYSGLENFIDGVGKDIQIAIYDAKTLAFKRSLKWEPASGQVEVCGLTVDTKNQLVWMADWVNGSHLYKYDLADGKYLGKVALLPAPKMQQGIQYFDGHIYITADDGDADLNEHDRIYSVVADPMVTSTSVQLVKALSEVKRAGEIEGLSVDPITHELMVLVNRGRRIVLGMPKEFYVGYDKEIHEVYFYKAATH